MAARFFFDILNGKETISDREGIEASDVDEALTEARGVIAEMADEVAGADLDRRWTLIVRDGTGSVLGRLPIKR